MTDTKIQRLRGIAAWLEAPDWTNMAANVREAASELERLYAVEASIKSGTSGTIPANASGVVVTIKEAAK